MIKNYLKKKKKGFTLIELIVVVSIILILSGLMIPKLIGYQSKAKDAKAVNSAQQIYNATMESYVEGDGHLDATKLYTSISAVSDLVTAADVKVASTDDQTATISFKSDSKNYSVTVKADTSFYSVTDGSASSAFYQNK